jgi:hypothetical protein
VKDLAVFVGILFMLAIFAGPISILIAKFKTDSLILLILKRVFQSLFIFAGMVIGGFFLMTRSMQIEIRLIGLISISLCYIGIRNEYFPNFKILNRIGIKTGRSNGKDGHGPEGQH